MAERQQHKEQDSPRHEPSTAAPLLRDSKSSRYRIFTRRVPAPLQRLFDRFPLVTYAPNELPARCARPADGALPTLHVFLSADDAARGRPSFNPSCLKWQAFLRIAGVQLRVVPSTNHASPSGSLPFLLPPDPPPSSSSSSRDIRVATSGDPQPPPSSATAQTVLQRGPIPMEKLHAYALAHGSSPPPMTGPLPARLAAKVDAYTALLDGPIRRAWLHSLYLTEANASLLATLYLRPATRSSLAQNALHRQLRAAASAELGSSHNGVFPPDATALYADARRAFEALSELLVSWPNRQEAQGEEEGPGAGAVGRSPDWFFGGAVRPHPAARGGPALFDAAVFSYTHLLLDGSGLEWADRSLADMVEALPPLVAHRNRMMARLWGEEGIDESASWEEI